MAEFIDFLRDSRIGSISLGESSEKFVKTFGIPTYWEGQNQIGYSESEIWLYGDLQLNLNKQREISTYQFNFNECGQQEYGSILFSDEMPNSDFTELEFRKYLDSRLISHQSGFLNPAHKRFVQVVKGPHAAFSQRYIGDWDADELLRSKDAYLFKIRIDFDDGFWCFDYDTQ